MNAKRKDQTSPRPVSQQTIGNDAEVRRTARVQLCFGWWCLLVFLSIGIVLEVMHGLKVGFYLDVGNETRRLMWTLGHAHGTLLSLLNIVFAVTAPMMWSVRTTGLRAASALLIAATILLPSGFLLGGVKIYGGDPGLGILLVPVGALFLLMAVFTSATRVTGNHFSRGGQNDAG